MENTEPTTPMTDEEATPLDWFILEFLCREVFGPEHEVKRPTNKEALVETKADVNSIMNVSKEKL